MSDSSSGLADYSYKRIKTVSLPQSSLNFLLGCRRQLAVLLAKQRPRVQLTAMPALSTPSYAFKMLLDAGRPEKFPYYSPPG